MMLVEEEPSEWSKSCSEVVVGFGGVFLGISMTVNAGFILENSSF